MPRPAARDPKLRRQLLLTTACVTLALLTLLIPVASLKFALLTAIAVLYFVAVLIWS